MQNLLLEIYNYKAKVKVGTKVEVEVEAFKIGILNQLVIEFRWLMGFRWLSGFSRQKTINVNELYFA